MELGQWVLGSEREERENQHGRVKMEVKDFIIQFQHLLNLQAEKLKFKIEKDFAQVLAQ